MPPRQATARALTRIFLCFLFLPAQAQEKVLKECDAQCESQEKYRGIRASITDLIATPERYDGKVVQTVGYLSLEFENTAIYLAPNSTADEALWVTLEIGTPAGQVTELTDASIARWNEQYQRWRGQFNKRRVIVRGVFSNAPAGHLIPSFPASITVEHVAPYP